MEESSNGPQGTLNKTSSVSKLYKNNVPHLNRFNVGLSSTHIVVWHLYGKLAEEVRIILIFQNSSAANSVSYNVAPRVG